ncbi:MAG: hypothetical protein S4CHLAM7_08510 [Chlamydiae bacterium]|nr:hypothetical protein [Chlamydiota bacterium]
MKGKRILKKKYWGAVCKRTFLFLIIFFSGFSVSGFYYHHQSKSTLSISGFPYLKQKGYSLVYDGRAKVPLWTHEHLTKKNLEKQAGRKGMHFYENPKIYPLHRSTLSDYYHSGYDRGHMVPAADQQFTEDALKETFLLSNICPQNPKLNQGYWAKLERHARELAQEHSSVDVVTGPLYLPTVEGDKKYVTYEVIGANNVSVPTHFYKIIQVNTKKGPQIKAYLVPNQCISTETHLKEYQVSIQEVEKVTGLAFEVPHKNQKTLAVKLEESI